MLQTNYIQVTVIDAKCLAEVDHALNASWSGWPVRCLFNGKVYELWQDVQGNQTNAHENLMNESGVTKVKINARTEWKKFEDYPIITLLPNIDAVRLMWQ